MHASLLAQLNDFPVPKRYLVALSGGCDSISLLHALTIIKPQLTCQKIQALHINHGLQDTAQAWERHCQQFCDDKQIPLDVVRLKLSVPKGESIEAYAREKRYQAFTEYMQKGDMLLLAQHQNDQAETVLLQLLRGAGVRGLAAMPLIRQQRDTWMARPLLSISREDIVAYATSHSLHWVDDPSNEDERFDRNYIRHQIMPALATRWPAVTATLSRAAGHQAEAIQLLNSLAAIDWEHCRVDESTDLSIRLLRNLDSARQRNLLRYWIGDIHRLSVPDSQHAQRIIDEVVHAAPSAQPLVEWAGVCVRRYRDNLVIEAHASPSLTEWETTWDLSAPLTLPSGEVMLSRPAQGSGIRLVHDAQEVQVRFRQGGERCRLPGREHHHELKKLFQTWGVPPWQRDRIPLIFIGDELAQVVGYSVCEPFLATDGQHGVEIYLQDQLSSGH